MQVQKRRVAWDSRVCAGISFRSALGSRSYTALCQLALCVEVSLALFEVSRRCGRLALFQMAGRKLRTSQLSLAALWHWQSGIRPGIEGP